MLADPPIREERYNYFHPTMGLLYLIGALRRHFPSTEVEVRYQQGFGSLPEHLDAIAAYRPDIYGLSFKTPMARLAYRTINAVKMRYPHLPVIAGGSHVSLLHSEAMANTRVDACFRGECEDSTVALMESWADGRPRFDEVAGAVFRSDGGVIANPVPSFKANLDDLAWPAWDTFEPRDFTGPLYKKGRSYLGVLVSRGCPHACTFCSEPVWKIFGKPSYRARSPRDIVDEVEHHYHMGVREVRLWCEELNHKTGWLMELMDGIAALDHPDLWITSDVRADNVTKEIAQAMAAARMWMVHVGMESGSNRTLGGLQKRITTDQIEHACEMLTGNGIRVLGYFQFYSAWEEAGTLCWETTRDCHRTMDWISHLHGKRLLHYVTASVATPRPGTPLWDLAERHGLFKVPLDRPFPYLVEGMRLPGITRAEVRKTMLEANFLRASIGLRSGNVNLRNVPFYLRRTLQRLLGK